MTRSLGVKVAVLILMICCGSLALAQTTTTGLRGKVENENAGLPGALVTLKSPVLQGVRTTSTSANGDYAFTGIPPGDYTVTVSLQGFQPVTKTIKLSSGQLATQDVALALSGISTATTVTAVAETVSTTTTASTTLTSDIMDNLPVARTILSSVELSSGLSRTVGLNNSATISGAQTFDNLFTVDGAVITDNIRGTPNNLFVEDAIQETTTSVNSVSAEFGRFTGGVINTVTKSGGNLFSGSVRMSLNNDAWSAISPAGEARIQDVTETYEATLGGPIWKDRIWFFGSGRLANVTDTRQTVAPTNISYTHGDDQKRYQGKITLTPFASQTFAVNYLKIKEDETGNTFGNVLDLDSLVTRQLPQEILTANYNGVITSNFFVEALYSKRKYSFVNSGSVYTDLIKGTLMRDRNNGNARYNAPTFCGVCGPEARDNEDYLVKGTYFLSTGNLGSHNVVLGYDHFTGTRKANNYQSGSNYRLFTTSTILQNGDIFPVIDNRTYIYYTPIDTLSQGSDVLTQSAFLNDAWRINDRLSANLGVRYDKNDAKDSRGVVTAKDSAWSPRLALQYDVSGKGTAKIGASYARYVGGIQETIIDSASNAGRYSTFYWYYATVPGGPVATPINSPAGSTLVTRAQALQQVFNWFFAQGCPDLSTCKVPFMKPPIIPGLTVQIPADGVSSPYANEYTVGASGSIGRFSYRADIVRREFKDSYYTLLDLTTGTASTAFGQKFNVGIQGNTNDLFREYTGLQTQLQYRAGRVNLTANWTWSHTLGNNDGETVNNGPGAASFKMYPEYKDPVWNNPTGSLQTDQRHRIRIFGSYDLPVPQSFGSLSLGFVQAYDTGTPYGAVGTVRSRDFVTNPGYQTAPSTVTYYYTPRDAFQTDDVKRTDLSLNYSIRIGGLVEIFVQPQVVNVFNNQAKIAVNTTVQSFATTTGYLNFNPFTTLPVQGARNTTTPTANWNYGPSFGAALNAASYQQPRTFLATMGVRF